MTEKSSVSTFELTAAIAGHLQIAIGLINLSQEEYKRRAEYERSLAIADANNRYRNLLIACRQARS